jgi:hypothetical protein
MQTWTLQIISVSKNPTPTSLKINKKEICLLGDTFHKIMHFIYSAEYVNAVPVL